MVHGYFIPVFYIWVKCYDIIAFIISMYKASVEATDQLVFEARFLALSCRYLPSVF